MWPFDHQHSLLENHKNCAVCGGVFIIGWMKKVTAYGMESYYCKDHAPKYDRVRIRSGFQAGLPYNNVTALIYEVKLASCYVEVNEDGTPKEN